METNKEIKHTTKKSSNYLLPIIIIIGIPLILALLITAATLIFQPYAKGCEYNGTKRSHLEQFTATDECNTCTCNDGNVSCTLMYCGTDLVRSESEALTVLKEEYTEFENYPNVSNRNGFGESTLIEENESGWYITFLMEGSGRPIISGSCFFVGRNNEIEKIGDATPDTNEIDIKTCVKPESEFSLSTDLERSFLGDEPFPSDVMQLSQSGITEFSCTHNYETHSGKLTYWDEESKNVITREDSILLGYIDLDEELPKNLSSVQLCKITEDKQLLVRTYPQEEPPTYWNKFIFTLFEGSESIIAEKEISTEESTQTTYYPIDPILYLEEENSLYYEFAFADGLYGFSYIFKFPFATEDAPKLIYQCDAEPDESSDVITQQVITCH